jgi:hypothetical protein
MLGEVGTMASAVSVAFVTCNVVEPTCPANTAPIVEVPGVSPVTIPFKPPALLTVATEADEEVQVTTVVRFCVDPSANLPNAVRFVDICWGTEGFDGEMSISFKADDSTIRLAVPLTAPTDAVMTAVPAD